MITIFLFFSLLLSSITFGISDYNQIGIPLFIMGVLYFSYRCYIDLQNLPSLSSNSMKVKILFFVSNPVKKSNKEVKREVEEEVKREVEEEVRNIKKGLKLSNNPNYFDLKYELATQISDIQTVIRQEKPTIVHFSGHGTKNGLLFQDNSDKPKEVTGEALADLFKLLKKHVNIVFLNSCYSENQAKEIQKHIPYVVGMNNAITNEAAFAFSEEFYKALGDGETVEKAYEYGISGIRIRGLEGDTIPVLLKKK